MRARVPLVLASLCALGGCRPDHRPTTADQAAVRSVLDRQKEAWNRGDIDGFMDGYHRRPDIIFTSAGNIRRGWDDTIESYRTRDVAGGAMGHLEFSEVELQPGGPDGMVALGHWELTETPEAAGGVFSLVFTRLGGRWGIVHDHSSKAAEPAP